MPILLGIQAGENIIALIEFVHIISFPALYQWEWTCHIQLIAQIENSICWPAYALLFCKPDCQAGIQNLSPDLERRVTWKNCDPVHYQELSELCCYCSVCESRGSSEAYHPWSIDIKIRADVYLHHPCRCFAPVFIFWQLPQRHCWVVTSAAKSCLALIWMLCISLILTLDFGCIHALKFLTAQHGSRISTVELYV